MSVWSDAVVALSPYAWYRLSDASGTVAADSSGNGRNGAYNASGVTYGQPPLVPGDAGDASVTLTNSAVQSGATSLSTNSITYVMTLKSSAMGNGRLFVATGATNTFVEYDASPRQFINGTGISVSPTVPSSSVFNGVAHLIVVTVSATTIKWYVDGVEVVSASHAVTAGTLTRVDTGSLSSGWAGSVDEFILLNSVLTGAQVTSLYDAWTGTAASTTVAIGRVVETDTARAVTASPRVVSIGRAGETNAARGVTPKVPVVVPIGKASETESVSGITPSIRVILGQAEETDTAQALSARVYAPLGRASESNEARAISSTITEYASISRATETNLAQVFLGGPEVIPLGRASESDTSASITLPAEPLIVPLGRATETSRVRPLGPKVPPPTEVWSNDNWVSAHQIAGTTTIGPFNLVGTTLEPGEPDWGVGSGTRWWRYKPLVTGTIVLGLSWDTVAYSMWPEIDWYRADPSAAGPDDISGKGVYLGSRWYQPTGEVGNTVPETWDVTAGQTYYFRVWNDPEDAAAPITMAFTGPPGEVVPIEVPPEPPEVILPETYDLQATPLEINGVYGRDEVILTSATVEPGEVVPEGATASTWVVWTADEDTTLEFQFEGTPPEASYTVRVLDSADTVIATGTGSGEMAITVPVIANATYRIQVSTAATELVVEFSWSSEAIAIDPAAPAEHLRVEVYERDGITKITELPRRFGVSLQEPLNIPGNGEVSIPANDPILDAYPNLLDHGNIVKKWLGTTCIHGFRIQRRKTKWVTNSESAGLIRTVSGPSVHMLLDDFIVKHATLIQDRSLDTRAFTWYAPQGEWFKPSDWVGTFNVSTQAEPPSDLDEIPKNRAKYGQPENWPDEGSRWLWLSEDPTRNQGNFDPPSLRWFRVYRKEFTVPERMLLRLYSTADEKYTVYLDGEEVLSGDGNETGYTEIQRRKLYLRPGNHTLAVRQRVKGQVKADGADAFMLSLMKLNNKGKPIDVIVHSDASWKTCVIRPVPSWNKAEVLRALVTEAQARGVESALALSLGFGQYRDSADRKWIDRFDEEVGIGTSALEVQAMLSEGHGFDVWVDPATMEIKAWRRRGRNVSKSVALSPGRNLLEWEVESVDEAKNDYLIQYDGGWAEWKAKSSVRKRGSREALINLGRVKDDVTARRIMRKASQGIAWAEERAGSGELAPRPQRTPDGGLIAVPGARPFLDFGVGDTIQAPNERGWLRPHRVLSLSLTEDQDGKLSYDGEFEEIR